MKTATSEERLEAFEEYRGLLLSIGYRMVGSMGQAEEIVQEAWLRFAAAEADVRDAKAWLCTTVTRMCIDELRSARARREVYPGPWLPEPVWEDGPPPPDTPAALADSLSLAFLTLLETLSPLERAVFLLREVFDYDHREIAAVVGRQEAHCRKVLERARARVSAGRPRFRAPPEAQEALLGRFLAACGEGDVEGLVALLAADAVAVSDAGGKASAATREVRGAERVARLLIGVVRHAPAGMVVRLGWINGAPGVVALLEGRVDTALVVESDGVCISALYLHRNPDKLAHLQLTT